MIPINVFYKLNCVSTKFILDKVENVRIDLENKKVYVTSSQLNANELLESIKKTGKEASYVGLV